MTSENAMYGTGWKTCARCRLTAPDVKSHGAIDLCAESSTCGKVALGLSFGGKPFLQLGAHIRYELDDEDLAAIAKAVQARLDRDTAEREAENQRADDGEEVDPAMRCALPGCPTPRRTGYETCSVQHAGQVGLGAVGR